MMALTLQYQPPAYTLVEGLRESAQVSTVRRDAPDGWAREELLLRKLGPKGWGRVYQFQKYYTSGWGEKGNVLSPKALDAFFRFLAEANFPADKSSPSVFLTDGGGVELCWEDSAGRAIQVEFTGTGAEFYKEATEEEGVVTFEELSELSRRLSA
jgi:hypothetical protein